MFVFLSFFGLCSCSVVDTVDSNSSNSSSFLPSSLHVHINGESVIENYVEATCDKDGGFDEVVYCNVCDKELSRQSFIIEATGHNYNQPVYSWSDDFSECVATTICINCLETIKEKATSSCLIVQEKSCYQDEIKQYSVSFTNQLFASQTIKVKTAEGTDHNEVFDKGVFPTCSTLGLTDGSHCSTCGKILVKQNIIPATDLHDYVCDDYRQSNILDNVYCKMCGQKVPYAKISSYKEPINNDSKFISIGFDDFRNSDFSLIIPLLDSYNAKATFNHISYWADPTSDDKYKVQTVINHGNQVGDHTFLHLNWLFDNPLMNGQDYNHLEGNQIPFPTNEQLRNDRGDGRNAFGLSLSESVYNQASYANLYNSWGNLTDSECQQIRNKFSLYSPSNELIDIFDELSNRYLGTNGHSYGSYSEEKGCYEGGIFTGATTSSNYEVWEKIIAISKIYYAVNYGIDVSVWSWPGTWGSYRFHFENNGLYYYDSDFKKLANYSTKFTSISRNGKDIEYSFNDCLRKYGYTSTHDTMYPSRTDGLNTPFMLQQLFFNESLSRNDSILFSTSRTIDYNAISNCYNEDFFTNCVTSEDMAEAMYNDGGQFYHALEAIRHDVANGVIHGEVIDSVDSFSERVFFDALLRFCYVNNIDLITRDEANDVAFNKKMIEGNLIHNKSFANSIETFIPNAENVPSNPDGYRGDCEVVVVDDTRFLKTNDNTTYIQYGVPSGFLDYSVFAKGNGTIDIYAVKNSDSVDLQLDQLLLLDSIVIENDDMSLVSDTIFVPHNTSVSENCYLDGYDDMIMALLFCYSGGLIIGDVSLSVAF